MKSTILSLLLIFFATSLRSQAVTIQAFVSPDQLLEFEFVPFSQYTGIEVLEENFSFSTGIRGDFEIKKWLEIGASVSYSSRSFEGLFYCHTCDLNSGPPQSPNSNSTITPASAG